MQIENLGKTENKNKQLLKDKYFQKMYKISPRI